MELELHQGRPLNVSRFHVLDAGDVEKVVLVVVGQRTLHLRRVHSAIRLGHVEGRDAQRREYVARHPAEPEQPGQTEGQHKHHNGDRPAKGCVQQRHGLGVPGLRFDLRPVQRLQSGIHGAPAARYAAVGGPGLGISAQVEQRFNAAKVSSWAQQPIRCLDAIRRASVHSPLRWDLRCGRWTIELRRDQIRGTVRATSQTPAPPGCWRSCNLPYRRRPWPFPHSWPVRYPDS